MRFKQFMENEKSGVITAYNPQGRKAPAGVNQAANRRLQADLQQAKTPFKVVQGRYKGHSEKALSVPKIARAKIASLGRKYDQEKIVFGGQELVP